MGLPEDEVARRVERALGELGLTTLGERAPTELSFGERKRGALATVLTMDPELLAFDEPFSNLAPSHVRALAERIRALPQAAILASQDLIPVAACCDRLVLLDKGRIRAIEEPLTLLRDEALLAEAGLELDLYRRICRELDGR